MGRTLLLEDPATGKLVVPLTVQRSSSLGGFLDLNALLGAVEVNSDGEIEITFPASGPREFFRSKVE